ncbi:MAG: hypothetical protein ACODAG_01345 [Myxococcota bacterium]
MRTLGAVWVTGAALAQFGCLPEPSANPAFSDCETDDDCAAVSDGGVHRCIEGFCVEPTASGASCTLDGTVVQEGERVGCYTGSESTRDVGACKSGERECVDGQLTACLGEVLPREEVCNGRDDDCDGEIDELGQTTCDTGMEGACTEGVLVCRGTRAACDPEILPVAEECNGRDDDCDGEIDENVKSPCYPSGTAGCTEEDDGSFTCTGVCKPGTARCIDGSPGPCEGMTTPSAEVANGADDDCDGEVDEGVCIEGTTCYGGPSGTRDVGRCRAGALDCTTGQCVGQVLPRSETCGNMAPSSDPDDPSYDDDCNGEVDDVPLLGEPCIDDDEVGQCERGVYQCEDEEFVCATNPPSAEVCDDRDNDCDGEIDEDFDLLEDESNCGECGNRCGAGLTCCAGECMNLQTSEDACGECGNDCGSERTCCGGTCADLTLNTDHCGECGNDCDDDRTCCDGSCIDTRNDPDHCGGCGDACDDDEMCCGGTCALPDEPACNGCPMTCPSNAMCCNGSCVVTDTDESNCGECGNDCDDDEICCDGGCVAAESMEHCGGCDEACDDDEMCCDGTCVTENSANCGSCGDNCGNNEICCDGDCVAGDTDENCGACGNDCDDDTECSNGACCPEGERNCGDDCVDVMTNASHCGQCGNECRNGEVCRDGCCCRSSQYCRC